MENKKQTGKKLLGLLSVLAVIGLLAFLSYFAIYKFSSFGSTPEDFKTFIEGYGPAGRLVALGIQFLQVFIALIPGEFVEVGVGLAFGALEGTLICLIGVGVASAVVFTMVKKWGVKLVELFVQREKIDSLKIIDSEKKLNSLVFLLFFIPGTPKDLLTYVVPLTRMKLSEFLFISLIARIPSVASSTIGGNFFGNGRYLEGALLLLITGAVSVLGVFLYHLILKKYQKRKEKI